MNRLIDEWVEWTDGMKRPEGRVEIRHAGGIFVGLACHFPWLINADNIQRYRLLSERHSESYSQELGLDMAPDDPLHVQVGGDHYKDCGIQPVEFIEANRMPFLEGCIVKRITRQIQSAQLRLARDEFAERSQSLVSDTIVAEVYLTEVEGRRKQLREIRAVQFADPAVVQNEHSNRLV